MYLALINVAQEIDEVVGKIRNIYDAFTQRRHAHGDDVDPIKQIPAERATLGGFLQTAIRCAHEPEVELASFQIDPAKLSFLQKSQQFGLQSSAAFRNLVQKERSITAALQTVPRGLRFSSKYV